MITSLNSTATGMTAIAEIAKAQRQIAALLDDTREQVMRLETEIAQRTMALRRAAQIRPADVPAFAAALAELRVSTGELASNLARDFVAAGTPIFPPAYQPICSKWALVTA